MNWKSPHSRILPSAKSLPLIMGILNVGLDSFSDGGKYSSTDCALAHAEEMIVAGADIIDIGAESTKPNAKMLPLKDELDVLLPKLRAVRKAFCDVPISVDTYKPEVAQIAIEEGADIINDVYAIAENGRYKMAEVAARIRAPIVITHCCRNEKLNGNFFKNLLTALQNRIGMALNEGVARENIIADVGVGFGKTRAENFELVKRIGEIRALGYPILLGVSRKSMFAEIAGDSVDLRDVATATISAFVALSNSCDILRVHNVAANVTALKTISKII